MYDKNVHALFELETYEERLEYLRLNSKVGLDTFGFDRYLNQQFYHSIEWRSVRDQVIVRDNGCDLGCPDREINGPIYIHHVNPITVDDLKDALEIALNPDYLVCCSFDTHQDIHYGHKQNMPTGPVERRPNDTCPWKR